MFDNNSRTEISQLGEFGLIDHLTKNIRTGNPSTFKGIGDDAAVLQPSDGKLLVVTTDMLVEGVHFDLSYVPLKHLGYKSVMVNLSDVFAMNAAPRQITVSIALSSRFPLDAVEELYDGMNAACAKFGVDIIGGDTTSSRLGLVISVTAIGEVEKNKVVMRDGAGEGDLIVVSGDLGGAYAGLLLLEREKEVFKTNPSIQPDLEGNDYILERQLKPEARGDIISLLADLDVIPTSMIDVSDGLASEILHLCTKSEKGCRLYEEKFPVDPMTYDRCREFNIDPTLAVLSGGEDYELLFTVKQSDFDKIKGNPNLTVIGHITNKESGVNLVIRDGTLHPVTAQGWDSLKKNP